MGNQINTQQSTPREPQPAPKQLQTRQPVKCKDRRPIKKPDWLSPGSKASSTKRQAETSPANSPKRNGINGQVKVAKTDSPATVNIRQTQPPKTLAQETSKTSDKQSTEQQTKTKDVVVIAELTPTPDSANRTWSEDASLPPPSQEKPHQTADVKDVNDDETVNKNDASKVGGHRQRDSGISQLSTEEFERAYEELAIRCAADSKRQGSPEPTSPAEAPEELHQLLGPRLRSKPSPSMRQKQSAAEAATAAIFATEEQLLLRQELLMLTPSSTADDSGRHSACSVVNDDHLFPDAVTPSKVDSGLVTDYDVPYMDDETFFVLDDWYITDDRRWSYLRRSDSPQLASFEEDCQLTASGPASAKATPHVAHKGIFGLCFGIKSRA